VLYKPRVMNQARCSRRRPCAARRERYGKKPLTGEQIRWAWRTWRSTRRSSTRWASHDDQAAVDQSAQDHGGSHFARHPDLTEQSQWSFHIDWYEADQQIILPMRKRSIRPTSPRRAAAPRLAQGACTGG